MGFNFMPETQWTPNYWGDKSAKQQREGEGTEGAPNQSR